MDISTQTSANTTILTDSQESDPLNYIGINGVGDSIGAEPLEGQSGRKEDQIQSVTDSPFNDSNDEEEGRSKARKRNPENWKQNIRKRNKNKGLEYVRANGELCEKKKLGPPCTCKEKCYIKIGVDTCQKIFNNFWKLGDHALQNAYIAGCVRIFLPKHCYKKDGLPSRRFFSRNFYVTVNGVDTEVCKQAFLNIHAISNGRLDRLLKKKQEIGNTGFDERGRHSNKVNKIPLEKIQMVRDHINGYRKRAGFTGKRRPKKVELLPGLLNIRAMYRNYREEMMIKGLDPVCEYRYRKIFHSDFHLDFGKTIVPLTKTICRQQGKTTSSTEYADENVADLPTEADRQIISSTDGKVIEEDGSFVGSYVQISDPNSKEFQMKPTGQVTSPSYIMQQDVFRLDYAPYNGSQTNWIFPNSN